VERFDYQQRKAYVMRVECDYDTDAIDYTEVQVLEEFESAVMAGTRHVHGDVRIRCQIPGFKKNQVLHHEKRRGREALHARLGDAYHPLLAALSRRIPRALQRNSPHPKSRAVSPVGQRARSPPCC